MTPSAIASVRLYFFSSIVGLSLFAACAQAADSSTALLNSAAAKSVFEEIVVTARKRSEAVQSVPISITALDQNTLTRLSVRTIEDLRFIAPSVHIAPTTFRQDTLNVTIRGQRNFDSPGLSFDTAAAIYKDGVYLARPIGLTGGLFDIDTVEVLKGPQGTLVGRNATGGAILYRTKEPEDHFGGSIDATVGDYGRAEFQGIFNIPLTPELAFRAAVATSEVDGYIKNYFYDPPTGFKNTTPGMGSQKQSGQFSLKWHPDDSFKLVLRGELVSEHDTGSTYHDLGYFVGTVPASGNKPSICNIPGTCAGFTDLLGHVIAPYYTNVTATSVGNVNNAAAAYNALLASVAREQAYGFWSTEQAVSNSDVGHYQTVAAVADKNLHGVDIKLLSSYRWWDNVGQAISRGLPYATNIFNYAYPKYQAYQSELTVNGQAFDDRLKWTTGLFFFRETSPNDGGYLWLFLPSGVVPTAASGRQITVTDSSQNGEENTSYAGYAQATYSLRPDTRLTAGVRYTLDERFAHMATQTIRTPATLATSNSVKYGVYDPTPYSLYGLSYTGQTHACALTDAGGVLLPLSACSTDTDKYFHRATWTAAVDHDLFAGTIIYATARSGYRAGAINTGAINPAVTIAQPEDVQDYEIGIKLDWSLAGMPVRTNLAGYYTDYSNLQIQTSLPNVTIASAPATGAGGASGPCTQAAFNAGQCIGTSNDNVTLNAKSARIEGFEWDVTVKPTSDLMINASGSYLDAVYTDYTFTPPGGYLLPTGTTNLSGTPFPLPRWQLNGTVSYWLPLTHILEARVDDVVFTGHYYWQSRYRADMRAYNAAQQTSVYGLMNLRLDINNIARSNVSLSAFVNNLTNAEICNPEYSGVLNSAPNATFGVAGTSGVLQCVPQAPRMYGVRLGYNF